MIERNVYARRFCSRMETAFYAKMANGKLHNIKYDKMDMFNV